jgi:hypothetical protein
MVERVWELPRSGALWDIDVSAGWVFVLCIVQQRRKERKHIFDARVSLI